MIGERRDRSDFNPDDVTRKLTIGVMEAADAGFRSHRSFLTPEIGGEIRQAFIDMLLESYAHCFSDSDKVEIGSVIEGTLSIRKKGWYLVIQSDGCEMVLEDAAWRQYRGLILHSLIDHAYRMAGVENHVMVE